MPRRSASFDNMAYSRQLGGAAAPGRRRRTAGAQRGAPAAAIISRSNWRRALTIRRGWQLPLDSLAAYFVSCSARTRCAMGQSGSRRHARYFPGRAIFAIFLNRCNACGRHQLQLPVDFCAMAGRHLMTPVSGASRPPISSYRCSPRKMRPQYGISSATDN